MPADGIGNGGRLLRTSSVGADAGTRRILQQRVRERQQREARPQTEASGPQQVHITVDLASRGDGQRPSLTDGLDRLPEGWERLAGPLEYAGVGHLLRAKYGDDSPRDLDSVVRDMELVHRHLTARDGRPLYSLRVPLALGLWRPAQAFDGDVIRRSLASGQPVRLDFLGNESRVFRTPADLVDWNEGRSWPAPSRVLLGHAEGFLRDFARTPPTEPTILAFNYINVAGPKGRRA